MSSRSFSPTSNSSTIDEIARINLGRIPERVRLKYERMSEDVFAFFRGTDHLFARNWASGLRPVDPGPNLLQCGDLHLENFGIYLTEARELLFDINDFDEALVAPAGFDITRCLTSILLAADVWKLSSVRAERIAVAFLDRYRHALGELADPDSSQELRAGQGQGPVFKLLGEAAACTQKELLNSQTRIGKDNQPRIRGRKGAHPQLLKAERQEVIRALNAYAQTTQTPDAYKVLSARGRVAGIGSLGVPRYLVLTWGTGSPDGYWLLDLKQAIPSSVRPFLGVQPEETWTTEVERILEAQRRLLPHPPAGLGAAQIQGQDFRIRAMIPAENRARLSAFRHQIHKLSHAVLMAGDLTGWSQTRGARYLNEKRYHQLTKWAVGPGLESTLATAIRHANQTRDAYCEFLDAFKLADPRLSQP